MKHFRHIASGIDVSPLLQQIEDHPELWNVHRNRTGFEGSPFEGTGDCWLRYRDPADLLETKDYKAPHETINYPAWNILTASHAIVFDLARIVRAVKIGGVLLTKIPAGGRIKPHHDQGSWHAEHYTTKVYVPIKANAECVNYCGGESLVIKVGDAIEFDNLVTHSVENNGPTDRWTLICCYRSSP